MIERCQERNKEIGQCELRDGHDGQHLAGYFLWPSAPAEPQGDAQLEDFQRAEIYVGESSVVRSLASTFAAIRRAAEQRATRAALEAAAVFAIKFTAQKVGAGSPWGKQLADGILALSVPAMTPSEPKCPCGSTEHTPEEHGKRKPSQTDRIAAPPTEDADLRFWRETAEGRQKRIIELLEEKLAAPPLAAFRALAEKWAKQADDNESFEQDWLAGTEKAESDDMLISQGAYKQQREDVRELRALIAEAEKGKGT